MAKKKTDNTEEKIMAVEEALSKTEIFIEKNQKLLGIIIGAIALVVLAYFGFPSGFTWFPAKNKHNRKCSWLKSILSRIRLSLR